MLKRIKQFFIIITLFSPVSVFAKKKITDAGGILDKTAGRTGLENSDFALLVGQIIKGLLASTGVVFLGLMVYAGFMWMTARGHEEQLTKAKDTLVSALMGLVVVVAAYAITNFITIKFFTTY